MGGGEDVVADLSGCAAKKPLQRSRKTVLGLWHGGKERGRARDWKVPRGEKGWLVGHGYAQTEGGGASHYYAGWKKMLRLSEPSCQEATIVPLPPPTPAVISEEKGAKSFSSSSIFHAFRKSFDGGQFDGMLQKRRERGWGGGKGPFSFLSFPLFLRPNFPHFLPLFFALRSGGRTKGVGGGGKEEKPLGPGLAACKPGEGGGDEEISLGRAIACVEGRQIFALYLRWHPNSKRNKERERLSGSGLGGREQHRNFNEG